MQSTQDLTVEEVSQELRVAYDTILRLLRVGYLKGYKADLKQWRVTREALDAFKVSGGVKPQGRPKKDEAER
jgi:excisionase family DNA binding protein